MCVRAFACLRGPCVLPLFVSLPREIYIYIYITLFFAFSLLSPQQHDLPDLANQVCIDTSYSMAGKPDFEDDEETEEEKRRKYRPEKVPKCSKMCTAPSPHVHT